MVPAYLAHIRRRQASLEREAESINEFRITRLSEIIPDKTFDCVVKVTLQSVLQGR